MTAPHPRRPTPSTAPAPTPSSAQPSPSAPSAAPSAGLSPAGPSPDAGPRWLNEAEASTWMNLVQILMLLPSALDRQLREEAGIPHAYYQILATLSDTPDRSMRMTDLARRVGTTASRLSHAVSSLEQRGWLSREAFPTDKRGQVARLTPTGVAVLEAAAPGHVAEVRRRVFDQLTPDDVTRLGELAAKIAPALEN